MRINGRLRDLAAICAFLFLAILFFWAVTVGGKTLLPADNVFAWEPWHSQATAVGVSLPPHNDLMSDLILENYVWKKLIVDSLRARQVPLWNPHVLAGVPFLAAGQHSALYPLSLVFYVLPLPAAYGWFAALHLFLAGALTYLFARTLSMRCASAFVAGLAFEFCGFMVIRTVFPMVVAAAVWLPLFLACIERLVQVSERPSDGAWRAIPVVVVGAGAFGMTFLAGHPEMYYYVGLVAGAYAVWRMVGSWRKRRDTRRVVALATALLAMAVIGLGLGAAQWLPLYELVTHSFRQGGAAFGEVLGWAYPPRRMLSMVIPDFFGNPAHHSYYDLFSRSAVPVTVNALGQPISSIYWGMKNYVEGAGYVGVLPLLLAIIGVCVGTDKRRWFFAVAAVMSLLFVFGSPIYYLVYKLPGFSQVHTPFRWIFPYSFSIALLAGMGADALLGRGTVEPRSGWMAHLGVWIVRGITWAALIGGLGLLGGLAGSLLVRDRVAELAGRLMMGLARAPEAFTDGYMFYSYQFRNLTIFGGATLVAGLVLVVWSRLDVGRRRGASMGIVAAAAFTILAELFMIGRSFFPVNDPALVGYRTPAVDFLAQAQDAPFRITSYIGDREKTFNANAGMFYGIDDVRGYDSIIPKQYVEYMTLIQEQGELIYNRIAPINDRHPEALDSPLLDMLNVVYVLADRARPIERDGYALVYDGEILIYRNEDALPRAYLMGAANVIPDASARAEALRTLDPSQRVIIEKQPRLEHGVVGENESLGTIESLHHTANEVTITVNAAQPCFLVLADSHWPGWKGYVRPAGTDVGQEYGVEILRANGIFRAVELESGRHIVRMKYTPNEIKFGLFFSFLAAAILGLAMILWGWLRFYREPHESATEQRVTKNTITPVALNLINRGIEMAFAMLYMRILPSEAFGQYYFSTVIIVWFDILTNFGLNTFLTREVARDRTQANHYLGNGIVARLLLCGGMFPLLGLFFLAQQFTQPLLPDTMLAITLFAVALVPGNISASLSALFHGYERMEIPAYVSGITALLKVLLGSLVLLTGGSYVGLAGISIVVNLVTMIVLYILMRRLLFVPRLAVDWAFQKRMLTACYPLMLNNLLAMLFFKAGVFILGKRLPDSDALSWYGAAYKYVDAVQIIPAYFVMAIFPLMSRYAQEAQDSLRKAYRLAVKLLTVVAIPCALLMSSLAIPLITLLGGSEFLPQGAEVLRVIIWYMPFGFVNSVTQYVLIALNRQRYLTWAYAAALLFNVVANVVFLGLIGHMATAYVAIASEGVLLIPFTLGIGRYLGKTPLRRLLWRQMVATVPMMTVVAWLGSSHPLLAALLGIVCYAAALLLLRVFDAEEREALMRALPLDRLGAALRHRLPGLS